MSARQRRPDALRPCQGAEGDAAGAPCGPRRAGGSAPGQLEDIDHHGILDRSVRAGDADRRLRAGGAPGRRAWTIGGCFMVPRELNEQSFWVGAARDVLRSRRGRRGHSCLRTAGLAAHWRVQGARVGAGQVRTRRDCGGARGRVAASRRTRAHARLAQRVGQAGGPRVARARGPCPEVGPVALSEALAGLASAMRRLGARWCLLGAQAAVVHGRPRMTSPSNSAGGA